VQLIFPPRKDSHHHSQQQSNQVSDSECSSSGLQCLTTWSKDSHYDKSPQGSHCTKSQDKPCTAICFKTVIRSRVHKTAAPSTVIHRGAVQL
jgi:hypothetical protein